MDNNTLAIYVNELRNQCLNTEASFNLFNQALANQAGPGILFACQMILYPGSQMAAMLWPTRARSRGRGETLRKALQLPEKHALNDRRLAELWERSDEKTDEWIANTKGKQVLFDFVGDSKKIGDGTTPDDCIFRAYNPETRIFYYRGVGYNIQALATAMSDVAGRVNGLYRQLFPDLAKADDEARAQALEAQKAAQAANDAAAAPAQSAEAAPAQAKKTPAKKASPSKAASKKASSKKAAPKKAEAKKPAAKKPAAKKAPAKKAPAKKPTAKK